MQEKSPLEHIPAIAYDPPKRKHYVEYFLFKCFSILWNILPETLSMYCSAKIAIFTKIFLKKRNQTAIEKIQQNLNKDEQQSNLILTESYINFAHNWVAMVRSEKITRKIVLEHMKLFGFDQFKNYKKEGRGVIIANMHFGFWEISPRIFHLMEIPLAVMVAVQHNPLSDQFINRFREQKGFHKVLHNRLSVRHTLRFLKKGGFLVIVADIDAGRNGIPVPFLNEISSTSNWPAQLSVKTDAPIIVGLNYLDVDKKRTFEMNKAIDPRDYANKDNEIEEITLEMNNRMSKIIEDKPGQWFWLQRRWKTNREEYDKNHS
jgi:Kdo2-lipid IVA lauroyltransferase/acyltransferase